MRKDSKKIKNTQIATIQGYHGGSGTQASNALHNYVYRGFPAIWYFNSDRKERTKVVDGQLIRDNDEPFKGYGFEIETECSSIKRSKVLAEVMEKVIFPCFKFGADMFKMQEDGSLGGLTSVEVITQVMTKSRIRNDYAAYKAMYDDYFENLGISAGGSRCGMHVNVSNALFGDTEEKQIEAIRKLYYIVNKHYSFCCKLFKRNEERTTYCGRMDYSHARELDLHYASSSHYNCMNLSHFPDGRIEIRLVGGQADYYSFRNTVESVFFLVERVRKISWDDCDDLVKIFDGCNQYVVKRLTECGLTYEQFTTIKARSKTEDFELHH